ncbi:MAG: hypothetical protein P4K83_10805 [Terracidiphilus sp.]|nr:hypothetical protein [Terracidiphilus sp.]
MSETRRRRRRWIIWTGAGVLAAMAVLACAAWLVARRAEPWLRARIVSELAERFQARVELDGFHVRVADGLWVEGTGLRIWPPASVEGIRVPGEQNPLIRLEEFRFHAPINLKQGVLKPGATIHVSMVELKGLQMDLPPKTRFAHVGNAAPREGKAPLAGLARFQIDAMECANAKLTLETSKPGKLPVVVEIARLKIMHVGEDGRMSYEAELTNPKPTGTVRTKGTLGPWQTADPGETPVQGQYRFEHADLGTIKGIAGMMNSTGQFQGTLRELTVDGATETPEFQLSHFGTALPLSTRFHAKVDATNGDTWLEWVEARLGRSHMLVRGEVVRAVENGQPIGHNVNLNVHVDDGRIEDFLRLTSKTGTPLMTGTLTMKTAFDLPPGRDPVHERVRLKGVFALDQAVFTSEKIQSKIVELSARGLGEPEKAKAAAGGMTQSAMHGNFTMAAGTVQIPNLEYSVPGATIEMKGAYGVEDGTLDFAGMARLQATVSQMVGGWKGLLLKPLDRYFKDEGAGTKIPIHISGTREAPEFGANLAGFQFHTTPRTGRQP